MGRTQMRARWTDVCRREGVWAFTRVYGRGRDGVRGETACGRSHVAGGQMGSGGQPGFDVVPGGQGNA
eukprot:1286731-Prymnesium_polylepis.1